MAELRRSASERLALIAQQQAESAMLRTVAAERREALERLHAEAEARRQETVAADAALQAELERSQTALATAVTRGDLLQRTADERLALIDRQQVEGQAALADAHTYANGLQERIALLQRTADERLALIDRLQAESAALCTAATERLVIIQRHQAESAARDATVAMLQADLVGSRTALAAALAQVDEHTGQISLLQREAAGAALLIDQERGAARAAAEQHAQERSGLLARITGLEVVIAGREAASRLARTDHEAALTDLHLRLDDQQRATRLQQEATAAEYARLAAAAQATLLELAAERVLAARQRAIISWWEGMPLRARLDDALRRALKQLVVGSIAHHARPLPAARPVDVLIVAALDAADLATTLRSLDLQGHPLASIVVVGGAPCAPPRPDVVHLPDASMVRTIPAALAAMTGGTLLVLAAGDELHPGALARTVTHAAGPRGLVIGHTDWRRAGRIHSGGRARIRDAFDLLAADGEWTPRGWLMSHHLAAAAADDVRATGGDAVDGSGYWAWIFHVLRRGRSRLDASLAICGSTSLPCAPPSAFAAARAHFAKAFSSLGRLRRLPGRALRSLRHAQERGAVPGTPAVGQASHGAIMPDELGLPERFLFSGKDRRRGDPLISHWYINRRTRIATCVPTLTPERLAEAYARQPPHAPALPAAPGGRFIPAIPGLRSTATAGALRHRIIRGWLAGTARPAGRQALCIGCHDPAQFTLLAECGFAATVISADPAILGLAGAQGMTGLAAGTWDAHLAVPSGRLFDVIWLGETLEKWYDPAFLLRRLHPLLRPGGVLLIETPNFDSRARGRFGRHWSLWDAPYRRFIFSARSLAGRAAAAGFAVARLRTCTGADDLARSLALAQVGDEAAISDAPVLPAAWLAEAQALAGTSRLLADPFGRGDWLVAALTKA